MGLSAMVSPNRVQAPSTYNFAFNEVQNHLGKPLNQRNLDELLKTVINTEGGDNNDNDNVYNNDNTNSSSNQQQQQSEVTVRNVSSPSQSSLSSSSSSSPPGAFNLCPPPPSFNFSENLSGVSSSNGVPIFDEFFPRGFGDYSGLEFGAVNNPQPLATMDPMVAASQQPQPGEWLQYSMNEHHKQMQMEVLASHLPAGTTPLLTNSSIPDNPYSDNQLVSSSMPMVVAYSDNQLVSSSMPMVVAPCIQPAAPERKRRISDEMMEKTIERRQKRMIKNRESAARSRARKQAYTNELENKVAHFRKVNKTLTKEKEVGFWMHGYEGLERDLVSKTKCST